MTELSNSEVDLTTTINNFPLNFYQGVVARE